MHRRVITVVTALAAVMLTALAASGPAYADGVRENQWYLDALVIDKAHKLSQGEGVTIGLIDTGVDATHPDVTENVEAGNSFGSASGDGLTDSFDHGTGIASILVGHGHGSSGSNGIRGIAPKAKVISVSVCDKTCDATGEGIKKGISWLVDQGVDIISISMGSLPQNEDSIKKATSKGVPIVASAGNTKVNAKYLGQIEVKGTSWPAVSKGVIPVSGTTSDGEFWDGSRDLVGAAVQPQLGLSAPATDIPAASSGGGYATHSGTSGSAPIVAGTLALIKSAYPDLSYEQWIDRLLDTVDDKGPKDFDNKFGWGIVNPYKALTEETTLESSDGPKVSSPADRLPLEDQGKEQSSNKDDPSKDSQNNDGALTAATSSSWFLPVAIVVAVVVVAAIIFIIIAAKRRKTPQPPPPQGAA